MNYTLKKLAFFVLMPVLIVAGGCAGGRTPITASPRRAYKAHYVPVSYRHLQSLDDIASNPIVIANIERSNLANQLTQQQIEELDQAWVNAGTEETPLIASVLHNEASDYLRTMHEEHPEFEELFLIDNKGCVTAANLRTADYWQGDEDKWRKVFVEDLTDYFIDGIQLDQRVGAYVHHYSLPITDAGKRLIGVLVVGVAAE